VAGMVHAGPRLYVSIPWEMVQGAGGEVR